MKNQLSELYQKTEIWTCRQNKARKQTNKKKYAKKLFLCEWNIIKSKCMYGLHTCACSTSVKYRDRLLFNPLLQQSSVWWVWWSKYTSTFFSENLTENYLLFLWGGWRFHIFISSRIVRFYYAIGWWLYCYTQTYTLQTTFKRVTRAT